MARDFLPKTKLKQLARHIFPWIVNRESEEVLCGFIGRCEKQGLRLAAKEEMILDIVKKRNYPLLQLLMEIKVYTERQPGHDHTSKIEVDSLLFLDLMHGVLTIGRSGEVFIKRLEKEDVVSMMFTANFSQEDVVDLVRHTNLESNLIEVLRVIIFWRNAWAGRELLKMAQATSRQLLTRAAAEVFTYGLRIDFLHASFYVYEKYREAIVESRTVVDALVQSLKDSTNYVKEKIFFLGKLREMISFSQCEQILALLEENADGSSKQNIFITSLNPLQTIFSMVKLLRHMHKSYPFF